MDSLEACKKEIQRHNAASLRIISLVAAIMLGLYSFFPLLIEKNTVKFFFYTGTMLAEFCIFIAASRLRKINNIPPWLVYAGFLCFFSALMFFGIYIGILNVGTQYAINFMIFLVCSQLMFVFTPLRNLVMNIVTVLIFSILSMSYKRPEIWAVDVVNASVAGIAGFIFNWNIAHALISKILTGQKLEEERNRFKEASITDELTGLSNRRDFFHSVKFYTSVCQHVRQTICIIMMDVDHFKSYNDFYGHTSGDEALKSIGKVLNQLAVEENIFAARIGGEEFIILWTENRLSESRRLALKIRQMIIDLQIPHEDSPTAPYITASIGMYILRGGSTDTAEELYNQADMAMYEAKKHGRNCIVMYDSADQTYQTVTPEVGEIVFYRAPAL
ncbi:GGDEF domain-containing protein [Breznakiella homolactica]|uniref:diguanylate cyclase n=1 Tax=Breznakiella homolactica TaxID=2798577 RepID=A0A7T7XNG5_9SPIR|nr:GGDEF domain-containing protein [Breznakiella homolactica]QQO09492.1 GGDEF domain-containing protein [Breznakiella homolactica]